MHNLGLKIIKEMISLVLTGHLAKQLIRYDCSCVNSFVILCQLSCVLCVGGCLLAFSSSFPNRRSVLQEQDMG